MGVDGIGEAGEVSGVVANVPTMGSLRKMYGVVCRHESDVVSPFSPFDFSRFCF